MPGWGTVFEVNVENPVEIVVAWMSKGQSVTSERGKSHSPNLYLAGRWMTVTIDYEC